MKKFLVLLMTLLMFTTAACASEALEVYVSITDNTGALVLAHEAVSVADMDQDGALTVNDALIAAHAAHHTDGANAYAAQRSEYGLSMTRLWGAENGGSYGYYLNNASAWSLTDPIAAGDHIKAYAFTDLTAWSDTYCYFDADALTVAAGTPINLTLSAAAFDEAFNPITVPVANAAITVNGEASDVMTDAEGKAVLTIAEAGEYVVSATSDSVNLVAPVCIVTVDAK